MAGFKRELLVILNEYGCESFRQGKGDHEIWWSPITDKKFVLDKNVKSRHTANGILKQAGIDKKF